MVVINARRYAALRYQHPLVYIMIKQECLVIPAMLLLLNMKA